MAGSVFPEEYQELLEQRTAEVLDFSPRRILELVDELDKVRKLLDTDSLYIQRFAGIKRASDAEDLLECHYVRRCLMAWIEEPADFLALRETVVKIQGLFDLSNKPVQD